MGQLRRPVRSVRAHPEATEHPLIRKPQFGTTVSEAEHHPALRRQVVARFINPELAAHSQVSDQCLLIIQWQPQILAPASRSGKRAALQSGGKTCFAARLAADRAWVQDPNGADRPAGDRLSQSPTNHLDLRKFGHPRFRCSGSAQ